MSPRKIATNTRAEHMRIGIVLSRFNADVGRVLLDGALRALAEAGAKESSITMVTVPGALEAPLALQRMAQSGDYDALVGLGAVVRGETFHFDIVATESASGLASVQLEFGIPIGNGILTTDTEEQALARAGVKGREAAMAAVEMANLMDAIDED